MEIIIRNGYGNPVDSSYFAILEPLLEGFSNESQVLEVGSTGKVTWTIVPSNLAAPTGPVEYTIGGTLFYTINGDNFTVPLYPDTVTVYPNPSLYFHYFWEREVYGDDPFTDEVEPSEPFDLGVLVTNKGYGVANNMVCKYLSH